MTSPTRDPSGVSWRFGLALGGTLVAWLAFYVGWVPGQTFDASRFILFDQGSFLYAIERMQAGERLYSEFAWQYGPLSLAWYGMFAAIGGNSPLVLVLAGGVATGLAWLVFVLIAARKVGPWLAWAGGTFGLLPALTAPYLLGLHQGPHGAVELLVLSLLIWLVAEGQHTQRHAWALGLAIGAMQLVRFGPHIVAGLPATGLWLATRPAGTGRSRETVRLLASVLAGYLVIFLPFAAWLFLRLNPTAAGEQLWPSYMVDHYRETYLTRWPMTDDWTEGIRLWLPFLVPLLIGFTVASGWVRTRIRPGPATLALLLPPAYFAAGCLFLFRSPSTVLAHAWMAWPAAALVRESRSLWLRPLVAALLLPACLVNVHDWILARRTEEKWQAQPMVLPNGERLWFHGSEAARFGALAKLLHDNPAPLAPGARRKLVVLRAGGGPLYFYNCDRVGRHWWYLARFVRPWEMSQVAGEVARHELLLQASFFPAVASHSPEASVRIELPIDEALGGALIDRLEFVQWIPGIGYVFRIPPR